MSLSLSRLGRYAYHHAWRVLFGWLLVIGAVIALVVSQPTSLVTGLTLTNTPSQRTLDTIAAELPQARGTQGSLVFTAGDAGRVDTPERSRAIVAALQAAQATGYVVDRDTKVTEQHTEITARVTTQVESRLAAELAPQLTQLATALSDQLAHLRETAPTVAPVPSAKGSVAEELQALADRAHALSTAPPRDQIDGASGLFAQIHVLQARATALGVLPGRSLPTVPEGLGDLRAQADDAIARARSQALAGLDTLLTGTNPMGTPLTSDGVSYRTVSVSKDGCTAVASLQLTDQIAHLPSGAAQEVLKAVDEVSAPAGLDMSASSSLLPVEPPLGGHEAIGLGIAVVVLLLTLGSLVAAGLPILTALAGVLIGIGGAFAFSAHYELTTSTPALGLMIGLAVGIDYALFIVHKHRSLVATKGMSAADAIGLATGTAGSAVLFAGLTVIIALLGLLTLGIAFVTTMAITAAATVALAVLIALTALPALLGLVGDRIVSPRARLRRHRAHGHPIANRWVSLITRRPILTLLAVTSVLGLVAIPATGLKLGMPSGAVAAAGSSQRITYDAITDGFGEGYNAPLIVTAGKSSGTSFDQSALLAAQRSLAGVTDVVDVALLGTSPHADLAIFQVTPRQGPTAESTQSLVTALRTSQLADLGTLGVTGLTAMNIDLSETLAAAIPTYVVIVVALSLIVLLLVFRSLLVPLAATAGFLLTMAATTGLIVTAFGNPDWTWLVGVDRPGPILSFLPIMATGILYGLANDYQVFLGTSIREDHAHGVPARAAVRTGFHHAGRVVVAAAIIMVSVFGGFVLSSDTTIRQFGFALSAGILIDAFLIRMTLIPALLHLADERAWWLPGWLDRLLPTIDIDGQRLARPGGPTRSATATSDR